ncbi:MAG TPA: DUF2877 domain-containing protein [Ktedonobacteraceae bacterium]|nr:DUF2877 domain-containing protein [Ktedonobacteraceae bacterium]
MSKTAATSYSASIAAAATGTPQRGSVHGVFAAAANIVFPAKRPQGVPLNAPGHPQGVALLYTSDRRAGQPQGLPLLSEFVLSLNAFDAPGMPNGLRLSVPGGAFPFAALRPGMPVLFGAQRLHIEAIECSLDLSTCTPWDPHIYQPDTLDRNVLQENWERLVTIHETHSRRGEGGVARWGGPLWSPASRILTTTGDHKGPPCPDLSALAPTDSASIQALARCLCGRGVGLTPAGDDILAGWMAVGWLLYGSDPDFLEACRQIVEVARQQTHLLSQCWLAYAARGDVALPIVALLETLALPRTGENDTRLEQAAQAVLAMGATSGSDVIAGILLGLEMSW